MSQEREYEVTAIERVPVRTTYFVRARNEKEAERMCKSGKVDHTNEEPLVGKEWVETISVEVADA